MDKLRFYTTIYSYLHNRPGLPIWFFTPFRRAVRYFANKRLPDYLSRNCFQKGAKQSDVVISLTSFPARIDIVWQVIRSLKAQSVTPEKIILWLSKEQFTSHDSIPEQLWAEVDELFEIRLVDEDLRSHKKYYYVMKEFPNKSFVTCDDDVYYHPDMLKHLLDTSRQFPSSIITNRSIRIPYSLNSDSTEYRHWQRVDVSFANEDLMQIGVGGVFYPPYALHELTLRKDLFLSLAPFADDIWLNTMARLKMTPVVRTDLKVSTIAVQTDSPSLCSVNRDQNRNDHQLNAIRKYLVDNNLPDVYANDYHVSWGG